MPSIYECSALLHTLLLLCTYVTLLLDTPAISSLFLSQPTPPLPIFFCSSSISFISSPILRPYPSPPNLLLFPSISLSLHSLQLPYSPIPFPHPLLPSSLPPSS